MNNNKKTEQITEPRIQVYVQADIDDVADRGLPEGAEHLASAHIPMLLDCTERTPITLMAFPEEGSLLLKVFFRYSDRIYDHIFMEFRILDCADGEIPDEQIQMIKGVADPAKSLRLARGLYYGYLHAEKAVRRLVPQAELDALDADAGILLNAALDSFSIVRGEERPALLCRDGRGLLAANTMQKPYFWHRWTLPDSFSGVNHSRTNGSLGKHRADRAKTLCLPAGLKELNVLALLDGHNDSFEVAAENPRFLAVDGVLYSRGEQGLTLFRCPPAKTGSLTVPDGVVEIGQSAFADSQLQELRLPGTLRSIIQKAFGSCAISKIVLPARLERLDSVPDAYYEVDEANPLYFSHEGVLYARTEGGARLIHCPRAKQGEYCVPEGVTALGNRCFQGTAVTGITLPSTLTAIEDCAFNESAVRRLHLPAALQELGSEAFFTYWRRYNAPVPHLQEITVDAANERFYDVDGVLFMRDGSEKTLLCYPPAREKQDDYYVPEGTTMIGKGAFYSDNTPKKIHIPKDCAVSNEARNGGYSNNLEGYAVFPEDCVETKVKLPSYCASYVKTPRSVACALLIQSGKAWESAAADVMKKKNVSADAVLREMQALLEESFSEAAAKKAVQFALDNSKSVQAGSFRAFYALLFAKQAKCLRILLQDLQAQQILLGDTEDTAELHPAEKLVREHWTTSAITKDLKLLIPEGLPYKEGETLSTPEAVIFVLDAYGRQYTLPRYLSEYESDYSAASFVEAADRVAESFRPQPFRELLEKLAFDERNEKLGQLLAFGRYADADQIRRLIAKMKDWGKWWSNAATGRRLVIQGRGALMLSDTRAAMAEIDRSGGLGHYARMRGTDADTLRDTVLSDFGFDADGRKRFDLGGNTLAVSVEKDLSLTLYDDNAKKTVKSVPKKGADPQRWEAVKGELGELRKSIRLVLTNRRRKLFDDFLSGQEQAADAWEKLYLGNPVLRPLAGIVVWQQGERSFLLGEMGLIDAHEKPYALGKEPVKVAHPIALAPGEAGLWQNYMLKNGIKQPFLQVWEPAYDPADLREDRYEGCELSVYRFSGREKDGISSYGLIDYSEDYGFTLEDCTLEAENSVWRFIHGVTDDATYKLGKFHIQNFSRTCNHIVFLLDKWTIEDRVARDDADLNSLVSAFTAAQISELIALAQEKNSVKALAQLLEIRNSRFGTVDLDMEFTLD